MLKNWIRNQKLWKRVKLMKCSGDKTMCPSRKKMKMRIAIKQKSSKAR